MNRARFIILGAGHFGRRALLKCSNAYPDCTITIVDPNKHTLKNEIKSIPCEIICDDGISYLNTLPQSTIDQATWIIPSIPIHVAFEWIARNLTRPTRRVDIPETLLQQLPNALPGKKGTVYMSYATFRCPDNCPEPVDHCYVTKNPRNISLFEKLKGIHIEKFSSIVLKSTQILPGIGGFVFRDLLETLSLVESLEKPVLLSTACRCHGVLDAFDFGKEI